MIVNHKLIPIRFYSILFSVYCGGTGDTDNVVEWVINTTDNVLNLYLDVFEQNISGLELEDTTKEITDYQTD